MNAQSSQEISLEEWADLDDEDRRELVDGHLEEAELPRYGHEIVIMWLAAALYGWEAKRGALVTSNTKLGVAPRRGRIPALSVYFRGAPHPRKDDVLIRLPPSIAVEVISPTPRDHRRDRVEKLDEYAAFGVRWYWLVDPELRTFEIFELGADGRYVHALGAAEGVVEHVPGCEGLRLDLADLWRSLDALDEGDAEPGPR